MYYSLEIPEEWQSGAYIAKFSLDTQNFSEVLFFVNLSNPGISTCLQVDATDGQTWISQNYIPVRTNRQYRVKCCVKGINLYENLDNNITIRLQTTDDYVDFVIANYNGTTEWQEISAIGIINSTENLLRPVRVKIQVSSGYIALFDEVIVEEL